jgi:hypothetical protein
MKSIVEKEIGGDGAKAELLIGEGKLAVQVSYPLEKIIEPLTSVVDKVVDKLEQFIPGDQTGLAADIKKQAREELAQLLADTLA